MTLRLVVVARRYWPLVGAAASNAARLAEGLHLRGARVTILTAGCDAHWPEQIEHFGARVVRLPHASKLGLGGYRFGRALGAWLRRHAAEIDAACVFGLRHDAVTTVREGRRGGFPVLLKAEHPGPGGDCHWQLEVRHGPRIKKICSQAEALLADSPAVESELIAAGYPRERIHFIPPGVPDAPLRTPQLRESARSWLMQAHPMLTTQVETPLAVCLGSLRAAKGIDALIRAWPAVSDRSAGARLWIIGDGPLRSDLAQQIEELRIADRVYLPGVFDDATELLQAADVLVASAQDAGSPLGVLEAMSAGLPVVASDIPGHRYLLEHQQSGLLVSPENADALADAVVQIFQQPQVAASLAARARRRVQEEFSSERWIDAHWQTFSRLAPQTSNQVAM